MRAPAAMLLTESSQQDSTVSIGEWGGGVAPGHPSPHSFLSEAPAGAFLCSDRVSIGKSLRCVSRFVSHRSHTKWKGSGSRTQLVRNERTNWTAVALIL